MRGRGLGRIMGLAGLAMAFTSLPQRAGEPGVLEPAVAGSFYPSSSTQLADTVQELLRQAPRIALPGLRALVCPHAGYSYSGPTAACGYRQLEGTGFQTVIVMGPSHYALFRGAALPDAEVYRTPLGDMKISEKTRRLGAHPPFVLDPECSVHRPDERRRIPGPEGPFTWEHSVEVQLPFLQTMLPGAELVPVIFGELDPRKAAQVLARHLDAHTLVVASSDLSHYHPEAEARRRDASCIKAICDLDTARMEKEEACGKGPILALMHLAKAKGWKVKLLDARTSGDTGGDRVSVVGYASIAFCEPEKPKPSHARLSHAEQSFLLDLARKALVAATGRRNPPAVDPSHLTARLQEPGACFVTLTKAGELRGCIGHIQPREALYRSVLDNARAAALEDTRFQPVGAKEAQDLRIEISVLTSPVPLTFSSPQDLLNQLHPGKDGVILRKGPLQATFLPQVWEELPDKEAFLRQLSQKARGGADLWKQPGVEVLVYRVQAFGER